MGKYLITGGTGNIGKYVIEELLEMNRDIRVVGRDITQAEQVFKDKNVELAAFDFLDNMTFDNALEGIEGILLMRPPNFANPEKDMFPFLQAAKEKGVNKYAKLE